METDGLHFAALAGWQSGYAAVCNTVYAGSIPTPASSIFSRLKRCQGIPREVLMSLGLLPDGPSKKNGKDRFSALSFAAIPEKSGGRMGYAKPPEETRGFGGTQCLHLSPTPKSV